MTIYGYNNIYFSAYFSGAVLLCQGIVLELLIAHAILYCYDR